MGTGTSDHTPTGPDVEWAVEWARACVARHRDLGLHFFGHALGVTAVSAGPEESVLRLDPPSPPGRPGQVTPVGLATLVDLAMSVVIRRRLRDAVRLGTTTLTVQLVRGLFDGPAVATAQVAAEVPVGDSAHATCVVRDAAGRTVAVADAWFVVLPLPPGRVLPQQAWEHGDPTAPAPVAPADLSEEEHAAVEAMGRAAVEAAHGGVPVSEALIGVEWSDRAGTGAAHGSVLPGPALINRVGHIQGGALFGMGVAAAERALGPGSRVVSGHVQYLSPAPLAPMRVEGVVLRRGRRAGFVRVGVSGAGRGLVEGLVSCAGGPPLDM